MNKYDALLKEVAREEEAAIRELDNSAGEALFLSEMSQNGVKQPLNHKATVAIAAIAAAVIVAIGITFVVHTYLPGESVKPILPEQEWVQVGPDDKRQFQLIDGTQVNFFPNSAGRLSQSIAHKGEVTLENGRVGLSVPHKDDTDWKVLAGPYRIQVTGTRFEINWNPARRDLQVDVFEGSVWVTGPLIEKGHSVTQNRSLNANLETSRIQNVPIEPLADTGEGVTKSPVPTLGQKRVTNTEQNVTPAEAGVQSSSESQRVLDSRLRGNDGSTPSTGARGISKPDEKSNRSNAMGKSIAHQVPEKPNTLWWLQHARTGNYKEISKALRTEGLDHMLQDAAPGDWTTLGNAARRAGDFKTARNVYQKLRDRYPANKQSTTAALYLGRMAFDQQRDYSTAAKWFDLYLQEQKGGPLHREALGRLMESQYNAHMNEKAHKTANAYLSQYPNGPHANKAKKIAAQ